VAGGHGQAEHGPPLKEGGVIRLSWTQSRKNRDAREEGLKVGGITRASGQRLGEEGSKIKKTWEDTSTRN